MPKVCSIPTCKALYDSPKGLNLTFHTCPATEPMKTVWEEVLSKANVPQKKYRYICSQHFEPSCFYFSGMGKNVRLKKDAVPTLLLNNDKETIKTENNIGDDSSNIKLATPVESESKPTLTSVEMAAKSNYSVVRYEGKLKRKRNIRSLLCIDVSSLNTSKEVKDLLVATQNEIITLRQQNKALSVKVCKLKKKFKRAQSKPKNKKNETIVCDNT